MSRTYPQKNNFVSPKSTAASFLLNRAQLYLLPLQNQLFERLDKRLVVTFKELFRAILLFRNTKMGLLLSELGSYVAGFAHAPAGTKRISNLLRSPHWQAELIDTFFFERAQQRISQLIQNKIRPLCLWDDSRLEKPESWFAEGLCPVESSKAKRLTKIKKGFYKRPSGRICVPGFHWTGVLLSGLGQVPSVVQMSWWTSRGKQKELATNIMYRMLKKLQASLPQPVLHVLDRGYANSWTIEWMLHFQQDFLIRWKKNHLLIHAEKGTKQTHLLARSCVAQGRKLLRDKERKITKHVSVGWLAVEHPDFKGTTLWLVVVRDKKQLQPPMYLLSSVGIDSVRDAWSLVHSYMHRWQIEQAFRVGKAELGMESPRLRLWVNRLKLLGIVSLVYDFLLSLLRNWPGWVPIFLKRWVPRTGNRHRTASVPIYRLRLAIANALMVAFAINQNSG
ncbi:transposase [Spirosoma sp. KUDC1026]|uniref:transposase n=1 Tax=Spirosoma sp. KUDC1026 TaxID=2745947 RepID=UPI00159B9586|nr:transposase [Spirosoma sp. KUDC1026]QKZ14863.1 transposase [Spirosoma sp. KUDC1026]